MPFMTGADRYQEREDLLMGIEAVLDVIFGAPGLALLPEIREVPFGQASGRLVP